METDSTIFETMSWAGRSHLSLQISDTVFVGSHFAKILLSFNRGHLSRWRFLNTFFTFRSTWENDPKNRTKWVETTHYSCPFSCFLLGFEIDVTKALLGNYSAEVCQGMSLGKPDLSNQKRTTGRDDFGKC